MHPVLLRQINWGLVNLAPANSSEDAIIYCYSEVEAELYHPSEVPKWICESRVNSPGMDVSRVQFIGPARLIYYALCGDYASIYVDDLYSLGLPLTTMNTCPLFRLRQRTHMARTEETSLNTLAVLRTVV